MTDKGTKTIDTASVLVEGILPGRSAIQLKPIVKLERVKRTRSEKETRKEIVCCAEERENRRRRKDEAGEWEKGKSPNTSFLQRPGPL